MKPFNDRTRSIDRFRRSPAAYKVLIAVFSIFGSALNAAPIDFHYVRANFTVEDGLSSNIVNAVLQTRDGFLWAGTAGGLVRFDGIDFKDNPAKTTDITRMEVGGAIFWCAFSKFGALNPGSPDKDARKFSGKL